MKVNSPTLQEITTINYTLSWPFLHHPSNTTFAGPTQLDICRCGPALGQNPKGLGHLYTRYRCSLPEVTFGSPDGSLWVFQAPLGHVNLLRPASSEELQRREELQSAAEPAAYAGKNFLLLSGPCPRGRYQAYATQRFLYSLAPAAREHVECLSLLIQPYEEDCSDDQGSRAYAMLARCIVDHLPGFKTLCLNIWGDETRLSTREFAVVLWKPGVKIVVSWDWASEEVEEYTDVEEFLKGVEEGVVVRRPVWTEQDQQGHVDDENPEDEDGDTRSSSRETSILGDTVIIEHGSWEQVEAPDAEDCQDFDGRAPAGVEGAVEIISDSEWSDVMITPVTPASTNRDSI